jgi:hypothetical protein
VGGILFDAVTFRWAIMFIVALEFIAFILLALFLLKAARHIYGTLVKLTAYPLLFIRGLSCPRKCTDIINSKLYSSNYIYLDILMTSFLFLVGTLFYCLESLGPVFALTIVKCRETLRTDHGVYF